MLQINQLIGFWDNPVSVEISLTDTVNIPVGLTTYTFAGRAFGAPESSRVLAVAVVGKTGIPTGLVTTLTIGGVAAASVVNATAVSGHTSAIWVANVPTGTTGDVVVTLNSIATECSIDIYRVANTSTTAYHTTSALVTTTSVTTTVNTVPGGAVIGLVALHQAELGVTVAWLNLTERTDRSIEARIISSASDATVTQSLAVTVASSSIEVVYGFALLLVSFAPQ